MDNLKFENMNLMPEILSAVSDMGFEEATPIQSQSIEIIRSGRDASRRRSRSSQRYSKRARAAIPEIFCANSQ